MSPRIGSHAPIRSRPIVGAVVVALAVAATSCRSARDETTARSAPTPTTIPSTIPSTVATTTAVPTTTVPTGPPLSERLSLVEVSVRLVVPSSSEQVLSISVDADALAAVVDLGVDDAPAWCSDVADPGGEVLVVRVGPPAVSKATGGIDRFELVAGPAVGADPTAAVLTVVVDGTSFVADGVVRLLGDDVHSGTFGGTTPDGTTVEGAFRCT